MKKYKSGDLINNWKIIEWGIVNPNTKNKNFINKPKYALIQCQCCKKTIRYVLIYDLEKLSNKCNNCNLIERNTQNRSVQIGNVYGKLTVIGDGGYEESYGKRRHCSWVKCSCNQTPPFKVIDNKLQTGCVSSCGCLCSKGEFEIRQFLLKNNINFIQEFSFSDLISSQSNKKLRFDFAIFYGEKLVGLIEFDGRQHIEGPDTSYWGHSKDTLESIQMRDKQKNDYCKEKGIPLLRIPYNILTNKDKTIKLLLVNFLKEVMPYDDKNSK